MEAAGAVAAFTADKLRGITFELQARVGRIVEDRVQFRVAGGTRGRPDELGTDDGRRRHHGAGRGRTGDEQQDPGSQQAPYQSFSGQGSSGVHREGFDRPGAAGRIFCGTAITIPVKPRTCMCTCWRLLPESCQKPAFSDQVRAQIPVQTNPCAGFVRR